MKVTQTPTFERRYKRIRSKELEAVNAAISAIIDNPQIGALKKGDLGLIRVHKIKVGTNQILIAYWNPNQNAIELIDMGSHENFYRDLKRKIK